MKKLKRLLCLVLAAVITLMLVPGSPANLKVEAAKTIVEDSGSCGANLTWHFKGDVLTISGTGAMQDYDEESAPWHEYAVGAYFIETDSGSILASRNYIKSVVVEKGVTAIGAYAFSGLCKVDKISLPSTLKTIGKNSFSQMNFTSVTLPASLNSIGERAFLNCSRLSDISIPAGVQEIGEYAFSLCSSLTSAVLPKDLKVIRKATFNKCTALKRVYIPGSVRSIEDYAFADCSALQDVYYGGSEAGWNGIVKGILNDALANAVIHYYSYNPFTDISEGAWYYKPVLWAYSTGVTAGTTATTFEPNKTCTRAEFVTFLYKFMGKPWQASWASECSFEDVKSGDWYYKAVVWANHANVTHGMNGKFAPNETLDRGMIITFLYNMEKYQNGKPKLTLTSTKFQDVQKGSYYYNPVLWAQEYSITNGTSATTFSPAKKCTRAEAVSFLYNIDKYWKK